MHAWAGIGKGETKKELGKAWERKEFWRKTDILIIDEVSMLNGNLFDKLNNIAKQIRGSEKPFGGIQLVVFLGCLIIEIFDLVLKNNLYFFFIGSFHHIIFLFFLIFFHFYLIFYFLNQFSILFYYFFIIFLLFS